MWIFISTGADFYITLEDAEIPSPARKPRRATLRSQLLL